MQDFSHLSVEWQQAISAFLAHIESISGSRSSRIAYEQNLHRFFLSHDPESVTRADVESFLQERSTSRRNSGATVKAATRNHRLMCLASFYKYVSTFEIDHEPLYTKRSPTFGLRYIKSDVPYKNMSEEEVSAFFAAIPTNTVRGLRDRAIFLFAFITCRRLSEIARMRWGDIEATIVTDRDGTSRPAQVFRHRDKGHSREVRTTELPSIVYDAIMRYLIASGRLSTMQPDSPLWAALDGIGRRGRTADDGLTPGYLNDAFHQVTQAANLRPELSFHSLRHAGASARFRLGEHLDTLMAITGHSNLASLDRYIKSIMPVSDAFAQKMEARFAHLAR